MEISQGKFEKLDHTVYGGATKPVPLFVDREQGLTDISNGLLHATNIIAGNPELFNSDYTSLVDRIRHIMSDNNALGFLLSDSEGKGAVAIDRKDSKVSINGAGTWTIPTSILYSMVHTLAAYDQE